MHNTTGSDAANSASSILSWGKQLLAARGVQQQQGGSSVASGDADNLRYTATQPEEATTTHWKKMELLRRNPSSSAGANSGGGGPSSSRPTTPTPMAMLDDTGSTRSGTTNGTSSAGTAREHELLVKSLAQEKFRLQQLQEMSNRNEQEFRRREGELIGTLQKLREELEMRSDYSTASKKGPSGDAVTDEVLSGLEEDLWNEQCTLQKLVEEEAAQGAAVVALADIVNSCDEREQQVAQDLLAGIEHIRRLVPLVAELRDIAVRTPFLMTPEIANAPALMNIPEMRGLPQIPPAAEFAAVKDPVDLARVTCASSSSLLSTIGTVLREVRRVDGIKFTQLQQQLESAQSQLDLQSLAVDDVHQVLERMNLDRELMTTELAALQAQVARQRLECEAIEQRHSALEDKIDASKSKKAQLASALSDKQHELMLIQRETAAVEREKQKVERRISDLKQRSVDADEQTRAIRLEVDDLEAANQTLQRQLRTASVKDHDLAREKAKVAAELQDLLDAGQQRSHQTMDVQLRCDVAETELRVLLRDAEDYERRAEAAERAAHVAQKEMDEMRSDIAAVELDLEESRRELSERRSDVRKLEMALKDLAEELDLARKVLLHQEEDPTSKFLFEGSSGTAPPPLQDGSPQAATHALEFLGMPQPISSSTVQQGPKQASLSQPRQRSRQWRSTSASTDRAGSLEAESMPPYSSFGQQQQQGSHGVATMWGGHPVKALTLSPERPPVLVAIEQRHYQRDRRALLEAHEAAQRRLDDQGDEGEEMDGGPAYSRAEGQGGRRRDYMNSYATRDSHEPPTSASSRYSSAPPAAPPFHSGDDAETDSDVFGSPPSSSAPPASSHVRAERKPQIAQLPRRQTTPDVHLGGGRRVASVSQELPHEMEMLRAHNPPQAHPNLASRSGVKAPLQERLNHMQQRLQQVLSQPR